MGQLNFGQAMSAMKGSSIKGVSNLSMSKVSSLNTRNISSPDFPEMMNEVMP
jgi:hypothetical protein